MAVTVYPSMVSGIISAAADPWYPVMVALPVALSTV